MKIFTINTNERKEIRLTKSGEYRVDMVKPGSEVRIVGVFQTKGTDKTNVNLTIVHKAPHTKAISLLKGAAFDQSSIRFFGLIKIEPNCPDTQSFLEERVLLLSDQAKAEVIPQLEIKTDDVKCSHAASVGQIPEGELFYLQSRGIPKSKAEKMIVRGFLAIK